MWLFGNKSLFLLLLSSFHVKWKLDLFNMFKGTKVCPRVFLGKCWHAAPREEMRLIWPLVEYHHTFRMFVMTLLQWHKVWRWASPTLQGGRKETSVILVISGNIFFLQTGTLKGVWFSKLRPRLLGLTVAVWNRVGQRFLTVCRGLNPLTALLTYPCMSWYYMWENLYKIGSSNDFWWTFFLLACCFLEESIGKETENIAIIFHT